MNVLIIEDEPAAAENLKYILKEIEPSITFEIVIDTVVDAIDFFNKPHNIELAFFDIYAPSFCTPHECRLHWHVVSRLRYHNMKDAVYSWSHSSSFSIVLFIREITRIKRVMTFVKLKPVQV